MSVLYFKNTYIEMISVVKFIDFSGKVNSYNLGKIAHYDNSDISGKFNNSDISGEFNGLKW